MINLCTICARGGSTGLTGKNIRMIAGKPLIAHSIESAKKSQLFDMIAVSSDSFQILRVAQEYGADIIVERPHDLSTDNAPKVPAIRHCVEQVENEKKIEISRVIDLDATSPLRLPSDITEAFKLLLDEDVSNVITACPSRRSPYFTMVQLREDGVPKLVKSDGNIYIRRQDTPACFDMNGSIFGWQRHVLAETDSLFNKNTRLHVMPEERSFEIDSLLDFEIVSFLLEKQSNHTA